MKIKNYVDWRKLMKNILKLVGLAIFTLSTSQLAIAESVTLKFHTFVPMPANSNAKFVKPWADKVASESNGEIKVEMYPSMQLGGAPPQLVDQVRDGVCLLYTSPSPRDGLLSRMPSSA